LKTISNKYILIIKLTVVFVLIGYLVFKIKNEPILGTLNELEIVSYEALIICFLLMFMNWGLEAKKWQLLIKNTQSISFFTAFKSVLAGLTTGLLTPNRLGNFIGRLSFIKKKNHNQAIINTQLGNLAQFISTALMGLIGLVVMIWLQYNILNQGVIIILSLGFLTVGILVYFKPKYINFNPLNKLFSDKTKLSIEHISQYKSRLKLKILLISLLRYTIFTVQYYCLIFMLEPYHHFEIFSLIATTFLITSLIPSFFFGKLFIRESAALFVFSLANYNTTFILLVAFILWVINLAIPASIGSLIWLSKKQHV
jgi:hypothetical protein